MPLGVGFLTTKLFGIYCMSTMERANAILEAPVASYNTYPAEKEQFVSRNRRGWKPHDRKLVTHPVAIQKVKDKFAASLRFDFDLWFVSVPNGMAHREMGRVISKSVLWDEKDGLGLNPEEVKINPNNITVFYTNNSGTEAVPLTAWTMAHRFGHAIDREDFYREYSRRLRTFMADVWGLKAPLPQWQGGSAADTRAHMKRLHKVAHQIGTMKAARDGNLRDVGEFSHELFAQYIMTGRVRFNRFGRPEQDEMLAEGEEEFANILDDVLAHTVGNVYVI